MAVRSFREATMDLEFPLTSAKTSSSAFTGWNAVAALLATGSASALSPPLPVSMELVSKWWITVRASNFDFGFRCPELVTANGLPSNQSARAQEKSRVPKCHVEGRSASLVARRIDAAQQPKSRLPCVYRKPHPYCLRDRIA